MDLTRTVLIVVDMQNGFVNDRSAHVVPAVSAVVRRWQAAGGATIFTRFINTPGSPYERLIRWSKVATAPETDLVDDLAPYAARATAVLDKPAYTLFTEQGSQLVADGGWTDLVLCGLTTESCVCKTAVDAFERNLTPWVLTDACGSHGGDEPHRAGLLVLRRFIGAGQLITCADLAVPEASSPQMEDRYSGSPPRTGW